MTLTELKYIVAVARESTLATRPMPAMSRSPRSRWPSRSWKKSWMKLFERSAGEVTVDSAG